MNTENKKLITRRDITTIFTILITGIITFIVLSIVSPVGTKAVITVDGKVVKECNLSKSEEFKIDVTVIAIKDKKIGVKCSDCPDKTCVKMGYISDEGEKIVCLPNKMIIKIVSEE